MAAWSAFYPWVKPLVPACPDPYLDRALCDAAIEFCETTQAFQERVSLKVKANVATYPLTSSEGSPGMVLGVTLGNERTVYPVYVDALTNVYGEQWKDQTGDPVMYLADDEDTLHLYPIPLNDDTGKMTLALRPNRSDTDWDDRLYERYGEIIANGALSRLLLQTGTLWADMVGGAYRKKVFVQGMSKVRAKVQASITPAGIYPRFDFY
jgi:hypothetical protein